jgi:S-adenosylmethionine:tRNA ribosyltransferase-isomerase
MIPAERSVQRPSDARLLVVDGEGRLRHTPRHTFVDALREGDLVVANDAATLPASLAGWHVASHAAIEVRLAAWRSPLADDVSRFAALVFGEGDYRTRTEDRLPPPPLSAGDRLAFGSPAPPRDGSETVLTATVDDVLGHPRLIALRFAGSADEIWAGLARHGRPIQYAHLDAPLALWDVWTVIAGPPVAFEPPSAGFALDWRSLAALRIRGIHFATITHAAGISSTGDDELDRRLPLDEPYDIPATTARAIADTHARGARVVAVGTTVVRALEHASNGDGIVRAGHGLATRRLDASSRLTVVDAILTGIHEPGTSHYELLRAFMDETTIERVYEALHAHGYRTHEFGDSALIQRAGSRRLVRRLARTAPAGTPLQL